MIFSNLTTGNVLTGYCLMILTSIALFYFFAIHFKRLKKMKLIWPDNKFLNKKLYKFFNLYIFIGFMPMFVLITIYFIFCLIFKELEILSILFTFFYLLYTIQVIVYISILSAKQSSIIAFEYEGQLILFNEVIDMKNIIDISHNLKRTVIFITFRDEKGLEDLVKTSYNWKLYDYLKGLNLK
ncbi:hypothetical protein [Spiroplasma monobiae]|uniref:Transmembrane protein n=1 Tax=Spiroplasma monobiae MQ-1 TaxID=1336748 RepID=A0A2K9LUN8_SPISQ|nr:hypothetical protein [Spiroplasma monobiae]AUM62740.1 hypothetical protein SMONO_v1c04910 [Spiroplasma monobiae MQ-1]